MIISELVRGFNVKIEVIISAIRKIKKLPPYGIKKLSNEKLFSSMSVRESAGWKVSKEGKNVLFH